MDDILSLIHPRAKSFIEAVGAKVVSLEDYDVLKGGLTKQEKAIAYGSKGLYNAKLDAIVINLAFPEEGYTRTVLHELGHWSGHSSRLQRPVVVNGAEKNSNIEPKDFDTEEIVAEMVAYQLGSDMGILTENWMEKSAKYIASMSKGNEHEARTHTKQAVWLLVNIAMGKLTG